MDKEGEIRVQSCSQNLFRPLKSGKLGPNLRIPSVPRGFSACTAGRKAEKRDGVWLEGVEENGNQYVKWAAEPVSQGRSRCRVWKALRRRLFILFGPLFRVKRAKGGAGGGGKLGKARRKREEAGGELPFRTNGVKRLSHQPNQTLPLHSSDVSIRLFPRLHPSPPRPILSLSSAAMPDINLLALDKSRAWPVKLFPPVAANLKRSRLLRISVISDDNQSKVVVEKKTAYRSVWFEKWGLSFYIYIV